MSIHSLFSFERVEHVERQQKWPPEKFFSVWLRERERKRKNSKDRNKSKLISDRSCMTNNLFDTLNCQNPKWKIFQLKMQRATNKWQSTKKEEKQSHTSEWMNERVREWERKKEKQCEKERKGKKSLQESQEYQQIGSINVARLHDAHLKTTTPKNCRNEREWKREIEREREKESKRKPEMRLIWSVSHTHLHISCDSHQFSEFPNSSSRSDNKKETTQKIIQSSWTNGIRKWDNVFNQTTLIIQV